MTHDLQHAAMSAVQCWCPWAQRLPSVQVSRCCRMLPLPWPLHALQVDLYTQLAMLQSWPCKSWKGPLRPRWSSRGAALLTTPASSAGGHLLPHAAPLMASACAANDTFYCLLPRSRPLCCAAGGYLFPPVTPEGFLDPVLQGGPSRAIGWAEPCGAPAQCWARGGSHTPGAKEQCRCAEPPDCHRASCSIWGPVKL